MKHLIYLIGIFLIIGLNFTSAQNSDKLELSKEHTALIIIDVQKFYFPGGQLPLEHPEQTSLKIKQLLDTFREKDMKIIHVKHNTSQNAAIHPNVSPLEGEKVFTKNEANSFNGTDLDSYLKANQITHLILTGMQTHMCLEATTRAAYDKGYKCIVPEETATTKDLKYKDYTIKAKDVHYSTLSTLNNSYARVLELEELLNAL